VVAKRKASLTLDADLVDVVVAHVRAVALASGGGVVLMSDVANLRRLAAPYPSITVEQFGC
jgi:hypothetical protein